MPTKINIKEGNTSLDEYFDSTRERWKNTIESLSGKMRSFADISDSQNDLFVQRQLAVETLYSLINALSKQKRDYDIKYAAAYNSLKTNSQYMYKSENAINAQIAAMLPSETENIASLSNFIDYMRDVLKTLDNMIYGIRNRIEIEKLIKGFN